MTGILQFVSEVNGLYFRTIVKVKYNTGYAECKAPMCGLNLDHHHTLAHVSLYLLVPVNRNFEGLPRE